MTYEEYKSFGGTLDETAFNEMEFEARNLIDWYTFNRLQNQDKYPEAVKRCIFKLIRLKLEQLQALSISDNDTSIFTSKSGTNSGIAIQSQSNDGVSVSYNTISAAEALEGTKSEMINTIKNYLGGVYNKAGLKLTYRGMYPGEEALYFDANNEVI